MVYYSLCVVKKHILCCLYRSFRTFCRGNVRMTYSYLIYVRNRHIDVEHIPSIHKGTSRARLLFENIIIVIVNIMAKHKGDKLNCSIGVTNANLDCFHVNSFTMTKQSCRQSLFPIFYNTKWIVILHNTRNMSVQLYKKKGKATSNKKKIKRTK